MSALTVAGAGSNAPAFSSPISMAFQPIVNVADRSVYGYEALVRGVRGESAASVLSVVNAANKYGFDQACRVTAIQKAAHLGITSRLHINFLPNAVCHTPEHIQMTLDTAQECGLPCTSITFEIVEGELIQDIERVREMFAQYASLGFLTAMDDFGKGYSGLSLLAEIQSDIVKLDMNLIKGIDGDRVRQSIVGGFASVCGELDILIIAEGVETVDESKRLLDRGIPLQQGYLFSKPGFEMLPAPVFPQ